MARTMTDTSISDVRDDIEALRRDLMALRDDAVGVASGAARRGQEAVRERANAAMGSARHVADQAESAYDRGADYVRQNPTAAVLIAMGVGALATRLMMMKNDR